MAPKKNVAGHKRVAQEKTPEIEAAAPATAPATATASASATAAPQVPASKVDVAAGAGDDDDGGDADVDASDATASGSGSGSGAAVAGASKEPFNKATYVSSFARAKRQRIADEKAAKQYKPLKHKEVGDTKKVIAQFCSADGKATGSQLEIPIDTTLEQLQLLINSVLANDESLPYSFFLNSEEIVEALQQTIEQQKTSTEAVLQIVYQPQAIFRVQSVTRCTSTIEGHAEAVLSVHFSSDGKHLASGSGDTTVRLWDVGTELPKHTLKGHKNWVLSVAWAPNGVCLASGGMDAEVRIWDAATGKQRGKPLKGHKKWITALVWEPMTTNYACTRLASASKDNTIRIWDVTKGQCLMTLSGHTNAVKALKWGGAGLLYSASQDRTIKVWDAATGKLVRTLEGHGHWVNTLALSTDYALRIGPYDHHGNAPDDSKAAHQRCKDNYEKVLKDCGGKELLVSGSDDFTMFVWEPTTSKKPIARLTGHQQPVNFVSYSPDGRHIASASFDGSVRLWNGATGKFVTTFRGHVQAVYHACWSADSRLLCSSSKDSTIKVWDLRTKKLKCDLPGHADEVFAVDWSPDGERVASGGKDKVLKIWRH